VPDGGRGFGGGLRGRTVFVRPLILTMSEWLLFIFDVRYSSGLRVLLKPGTEILPISYAATPPIRVGTQLPKNDAACLEKLVHLSIVSQISRW
jgi:hypothetical protein